MYGRDPNLIMKCAIALERLCKEVSLYMHVNGINTHVLKVICIVHRLKLLMEIQNIHHRVEFLWIPSLLPHLQKLLSSLQPQYLHVHINKEWLLAVRLVI